MGQEKIAVLLEDEAFVARIAECDSLEGIREAFQDAGCDITLEQAKGFVGSLDKLLEGGADELSEESLENVSGGILLPVWPTVWTRRLLDLWLKKGWLTKIKWRSLVALVKK